MTSTETIILLDRMMDNQLTIDNTKEFLNNADLVKFAKFIPIPSVNEEMMKQAYTIVQRTKRQEEYVELEGVRNAG
jgi:hypothetical protein